MRQRLWAWLGRSTSRVAQYVRERDPTFWNAFTPALFVCALLYVRSPLSNYIFDEQEAILANPYVNGTELGFFDVVRRDFWGLPPTRSIGSYRPLPNVIWRLVWKIHENPWLLHWVNVIVHATNAALVASFALATSRRRGLAWLAGAAFGISGVVTEAVTGVVGLADVLCGTGVMLAMHALRLPFWAMPFGVAGGALVAFASKESALVLVPLLPWTALVLAPAEHERPLRFMRAFAAAVAVVGVLVGYTYFRRHFFPIALPADLEAPLPATEPIAKRAMHEFSRWFQQPRLPRDPINNPLADADFPHRVAGALRVYVRGLGQVVFPWTLSGDYSFRQEPVPERLVFPESVLGALGLVGAPLCGLFVWIRALIAERRGDHAKVVTLGLVAVALVWVPVAYFPHSNIPMLLPTVRAERFWYVPLFGSALGFGVLLSVLSTRRFAIALTCAFLGFQAFSARIHALDYLDDLAFWRGTSRASPNSAKAHLNYGVMLGARGDLETRLVETARAMELAPEWPMAHVYYGDTLCRLHRAAEAWPHYARGFELAPNDSNLIALALQCLWDEGEVRKRERELLGLADEHSGSWLAYLAKNIVDHGEEHAGVEKKYRPRGYNEGPKQ